MWIFLYYIMVIPVLSYSIYYTATGIFLFKKNKRKIKNHLPTYKLGVIIASRNEEAVIGNLIKSLKNQNYPSRLFEIYVVPNNCTDKTEEKAAQAGARIIKCTEKVSSKGEVLKFAFKELSEKDDCTAYIIFDADNIVHPNFLKRMNDALCEGYEVAQGFRDSKNPGDNWICGSYSLFYWGQNIFFSKSRMALNGSAAINGTGFMVKKSVLREIGFNTVTMTEDIEFTAICALNDKKIVLVDDAVTYDEQPLKFRTSWKQRTRWSIGTYQCMNTYCKALFYMAVKTRKLACLDMFLFFLAPLIQLAGFFTFVLIALYNIIGMSLDQILLIVMPNKELSALTAYLLSILISVFVVKYTGKKISGTISGILAFPLFLLTWIPINLICLFKKNIVWEPISHNRNVPIESLIES